jgi:hypothetical protein
MSNDKNPGVHPGVFCYFAYVVGGYTCHDGDNKIEKFMHVEHPLPAGVTRQSYYITRF